MDFRNGLPEVENILSFTIETLDEEVLIVRALTKSKLLKKVCYCVKFDFRVDKSVNK